jgi:hypothetical protein
MKKLTAFALTAMLAGSLSLGTAFAFQDLDMDNRDAVIALKDRGVISGVDSEHFVPKGKISYAESVQMIVNAFQLNIDTLRFIKQPMASDIYSGVPNDAWYSHAFIIAHYNGLEIPKDVNPNAAMTREQFGDLLVRVLEKQGNYPLIKMFIMIEDEDQITPEYQGALQRLLLYKIAELDKDRNFDPKGELTRGQAAVWVHKALTFMDSHAVKPAPVEEVAVKVEKISDELNKITLSRGEKPNAGYGIAITGIKFSEDGLAVITYRLTDPDPSKMYAEVITTPQASTYVASGYQVTAELDTTGR